MTVLTILRFTMSLAAIPILIQFHSLIITVFVHQFQSQAQKLFP